MLGYVVTRFLVPDTSPSWGISSVPASQLLTLMIMIAMLMIGIVAAPLLWRRLALGAEFRPGAACIAAGAGRTETAPARVEGPRPCVEDLVLRSGIAMIVIASDTTVLDGNDALPTLVGRQSMDELLGLQLGDALEVRDEAAARHFCSETLARGTFRLELEAVVPGRGYCWIELDGAASVVDGQTCVMALLRDVSARKAEEWELRQSCQSLAASIEIARETTARKAAFVAKMNHELRTPLNGVIGVSEMLRHTASDRIVPGAEVRRYCDLIYRSGTHLLSLVDDLLDLSRLESGGWSLSPTRIDVRTETEAALLTLSPLARKRRVTVDNACSPGVDWVADRRAFRQIVINLASNAVKFSPCDTTIRLTVTVTEATMTLHVADQGPGIPEYERERILTPFGRGAHAVNHGIDGSGLGLAIVSELLALHGGVLTIESEPGRGSTFAATFPVAADKSDIFRLAAE